MPYAYRKSERIRKNTEFVATMKGKRLSINGLTLFFTRNSLNNFRVGVTVSKRLANAVGRNKMKRQIRSCITAVIGDKAAGYDMVFVARQELLSGDHARILQAVEKVLARSSVLDRSRKPEGSTQ